MIELTPRQAKLLLRHVRAFNDGFRNQVADTLARYFRGVRPTEVIDLLEQLSILGRQLEMKQDPVKVHGIHSRLLRRILIDERRAAAEALDEPLRRAMDRRLVAQLRGQLAPLEALMQSAWFTSTEALPLPRLTDYMSVRHAEEALSSPLTLAPREFDEKFHILEAPSLFYRDLQYYRRKCALRDAQLAVAYADIDDFKTLNTRYTETRVDLDVLAPFMGAIEAHMFAHGHAYRFGGDEYVLLLPNAAREVAARFLSALQRRLARTSYRGVTERPTLSIGYALVDRDTVLTDREVLAAANRAKNYVKAQQKGAIATFDGLLFRDDDL
ncbi:MAG TPA: diguanylate cyclase, partial [Sorangium sp.]|nr:diguanylate cyclase [Sorangium sp.]